MAIRADSFAKKLRKFAKDIPKKNNEIKKAVLLEGATLVVADTPILSGQAQNNYFFANTPDKVSVTYGPFNGARGGTMSLARAQKAAQALKPGQDVYMTNNLPYIGWLNDGYSTQAPARFIQTAIARAIRVIEKQRIRYGDL